MITVIALCLFFGGIYSMSVHPTFIGVGMILIGLVVLLARLSCRK